MTQEQQEPQLPAEALTQGALTEIVAAVLERAAFVFSEVREEPWSEQGPVWSAEIAISCRRAWTLATASTPEFAALLASNLLGIDPDDPAAHESAEDALREISNMICGAVIDHLQCAGFPGSMGTPRLRKLESTASLAPREGSSIRVGLLAENHCVDVALIPR